MSQMRQGMSRDGKGVSKGEVHGTRVRRQTGRGLNQIAQPLTLVGSQVGHPVSRTGSVERVLFVSPKRLLVLE